MGDLNPELQHCEIVGPYLPVGDTDWTCRAHGDRVHLKDPSRAGAPDLRREEFYCLGAFPEPQFGIGWILDTGAMIVVLDGEEVHRMDWRGAMYIASQMGFIAGACAAAEGLTEDEIAEEAQRINADAFLALANLETTGEEP